MPKLTYLDLNDYASTVYEAQISYRTRFAALSFYKQRYSSYAELFLILIQYMQLVSQVILYSGSIYEEIHPTGFVKRIYYVAKLLNPGYFITDTQNTKTLWGLLIGLCLFELARCLLAFYILQVSLNKYKSNIILPWLWKWTFKTFQTTFFTTLSMYSGIIIAFEKYGVPIVAPTIICLILVLFEFSIVLGILNRWAYKLPSSSLLSSKSTTIELIINTQTLIISILRVGLPSTTISSLWLVTLIFIFSNLTMNCIYLQTLPNYNIKILYYRGTLMTLVTTLSIVYVVRAFAISAVNSDFEITSILITWWLLAPLSLKLFQTTLKKRLNSLLTVPPGKLTLDLITHKVLFIKYLLRTQIQYDSQDNQSINLSCLLYTGINRNFDLVFSLTQEDLSVKGSRLEDKEIVNRLIVNYLEFLLSKSPKDEFLRLFIAYYYIEKLNTYGNAFKLLSSLDRSSSKNTLLAVCLLRYEIQTKINGRHQYKNTDTTKIDLTTYIKSEQVIDDLKKSIANQVALQINLCQEYKRNTIDLIKLFDLGQEIDAQRKIIKSKMKIILDLTPDHYIEPWIIAQYYSLVANHSISGYIKYRRITQYKYDKYEKTLLSNNFETENMHDPRNVFVLTAYHHEKRETIVSCSRSIEETFGWDPKHLTEKEASLLVPPVFQDLYDDKMDEYFREDSGGTIEDHRFLLHKLGFMREVNFCFTIYPFLSQDFYLGSLIRPIKSYADYILLTNDGKIYSFTERFGRKLGLISSTDSVLSMDIHIREISEELFIRSLKEGMVACRHPNEIELDLSPRKQTLQSNGSFNMRRTSVSESNVSPVGFMRIRRQS